MTAAEDEAQDMMKITIQSVKNALLPHVRENKPQGAVPHLKSRKKVPNQVILRRKLTILVATAISMKSKASALMVATKI
jgi:hypothetical protein